ncbi:MAG: fumarylacetoacetate hydrolase family protein, partial [Chloroflexota bacterium]|nr:fumarylacetoacetate hydrolase family protein [Chloroflexota bacterium]
MQLVSYRIHNHTDGDWRAGVEDEGRVVDVTALWHDGVYVTTTKQLLAAGPATVRKVFKQAREALDAGPDAPGMFQTASVELGPPVPDPDKIICIGLNYADHASEAGLARTEVPVFFAKFRNSLTGPTSPILLPRVSSQIDYEGELAVIMGTRCKEVSEQEALQYVAGYTIMNDVSARDLQMQTSQYMAGKALDTFAPMGPGIVLAADIPNPQTLLLTTRVNGQVVQHANTSTMIFSVATIISFLSSLMTLEPGDIIATGTPSGVGFKRTPPLFLREGDVVEVEIDGIGQLRNPVV